MGFARIVYLVIFGKRPGSVMRVSILKRAVHYLLQISVKYNCLALVVLQSAWRVASLPYEAAFIFRVTMGTRALCM